MSTCKSCHQPILWGTTAAGKPIPLDLPPERRFVVQGKAGEGDGSPKVVSAETYKSHFSSCPSADAFRKPR